MHFLKRLVYSIAIGVPLVLYSCKAKEDIKLDERLLFPVPICTEADPELNTAEQRQSFLENLIKENPMQYAADIIYFHESNKKRYTRVMKKEYSLDVTTSQLWEGMIARKNYYASLTIIPRDLVGKGKRSVLIVMPSAFEKITKEEDILSFILDHEATHVNDNATGIELGGEKITPEIISSIGPLKYQDIIELRAYEAQLVQIESSKRNVSEECKTLVIKAYFRTYSQVLRDALKGEKYSLLAIQDAKYLPMVNLENKEIVLFKKEQKAQETPK